MSNFTETFVASIAGITVFYLLEALYYEVKARINGRNFIKFVEDEEDEYWDKQICYSRGSNPLLGQGLKV